MTHRGGGGHAKCSLSDDERETIRDEILRLNIFSNDETRDKVSFCVEIRRLWKDLSDDKVDKFLERNKKNYLKMKT